MRHNVVDLNLLSPQDQLRFKSLTATPGLSWPVLLLWLLVLGAYVMSWVGGLAGWLPLWAGMLINSVAGYYAFSIAHDSIHRAVSRNTRLNDAIGQSAIMLGAPYVSLSLFRWAHILHHRFANSARDPDWILHGPAWSLPWRWMFIDVLYLRHTLKNLDPVSRRHLRASMRWALGSLVLFTALIASGYGWHLLMLWLIPSRVLFVTLGFAFFWLPHVPHDTAQADNLTRATTVRLGHEWILSPLLQWQNYHLIHHLWPTTPFYNNRRVWRLVEGELRQQDLSIQHGLALYPTRQEA
ncbi:fatty acid desaturase [Oceanococcus atlanticus]|uniref:Fatty acid desaturase n=1 Tax=Oceanococcus atlanticus TaxID=1317117 RepID=A0A1Y1SB05_9GAMM|nr:fatty acid desaturase [Oceanococcus atlanticus]ORE85820.1 fatty acid desaturase [Oceanococcus atlanticus]